MKRLTCAVSFLVVLGVAAGAWAGAQEELAQNRQQLLQALLAGNLEALGALYAEDAHYTPATSPFRRENREDIKALWAGVFQSFPTRRLVVRQIHVRVYGPSAVETGYFDFTGVDRAGTAINISGRYSMTFAKLGDKWVIVDQHVSELPRYGIWGPASRYEMPTFPFLQAP